MQPSREHVLSGSLNVGAGCVLYKRLENILLTGIHTSLSPASNLARRAAPCPSFGPPAFHGKGAFTAGRVFSFGSTVNHGAACSGYEYGRKECRGILNKLALSLPDGRSRKHLQ
jgi:hypothetical protein